MRPLYAVQFEVASPKSEATSDVAEETLQAVLSWIAEWYQFRKGIKIEFPAGDGSFSPCQSHELRISREVSQLGEVRHATVSWSYAGQNDGNLLWNSRCDVSKFGGLTEFSFQLLLESTQFYIAPVEFKLQRPRIALCSGDDDIEHDLVVRAGSDHDDRQIISHRLETGYRIE